MSIVRGPSSAPGKRGSPNSAAIATKSPFVMSAAEIASWAQIGVSGGCAPRAFSLTA